MLAPNAIDLRSAREKIEQDGPCELTAREALALRQHIAMQAREIEDLESGLRDE